MQLTMKQEQGLRIAVERYHNHEPYTVISGYAGSGKAQPIDTIIPTPEGQKKIGQLKPGDYVFDRTGQPTKVISVHPQGKLDVYTLKLKDGRESKCGLDHIWTIIDKHNQKRELTTKQLIKLGLKNSAGFKYALPNNEPLIYPEQFYEIDPYVIGAFLGDGCCKERQLTLSSETEEIPNIIGELIGAIPNKQSDKNYNWTFELQNPIINNNNPTYSILKVQTKEIFKDFISDICCEANEKRIPYIYKYGSIEQRLNLLQGLFDTDGSITESEGRFNIKYTSISFNLIKDIQEVLYSLGYSSTITKDNRIDKYVNEICYGLNINIANEEKYKLFRLKRKKILAEKAKNKSKHKIYSKISIIDIQKENYETEMVCIYVDNPEHLYLTNDCIVTHNTTLVKFIISALNLDPEEDVAYIAFTGKASEVLRNKGCPNAMTAHKLLYYSKQMPNGRYLYRPRITFDKNYKVIVVDEVSMLPKDMWDLLLSHNAYVIAAGDPFQIPPIFKNQDNHVLDNPHIFLDEIMRQAKESDIICLSMDIREHKKIIPFKGNDIQIFSKKDLYNEMYNWADQIIVATNKNRNDINNWMREELNREEEPQLEDKIICLHNCWDILSQKENNPLINGTIGYINKIQPDVINYILDRKNIKTPVLKINLKIDNDYYQDLVIDYKAITIGEKAFTPQEEYRIKKNKVNPELPIEFNYGYAITGHRAQGSQWDKVLVVEESFPFDSIEHARWLYTACTRATDKLTLILKN